MTDFSIHAFIEREARAHAAIAPYLPAEVREQLDGAVGKIKQQYGVVQGYAARAESIARAVDGVLAELGADSLFGLTGSDPSVTPPGSPLLMLGDFVFSAGRAAHQTLERANEYRWAQQDRLLRTPAMQWTGPGKETIRLSGVIYTRHSISTGHLDAIRRMASRGEPYDLTGGDGTLYGRYVITNVTENGSELDASGLARVIDFTLELAFYGEDV